MARRTFNDITAEVLIGLGNRSEATAALREQWVNDAYLRVANEFDHRELQATATETLTAGSQTLTPSTATDLWWIEFIRNTTDGNDVQFTDVEDVETYTVATGVPTRFYLNGSVLYFDAKPSVDTSLKLWYVKKPVRLAGTASSVLDEVFDPVIVSFAIALGLQRFRDFSEAHVQEVAVNNYVARMRLPRRQNKLNDNRASVKPRVR